MRAWGPNLRCQEDSALPPSEAAATPPGTKDKDSHPGSTRTKERSWHLPGSRRPGRNLPDGESEERVLRDRRR